MQEHIRQLRDIMSFLNDPEHVGASFEYLVKAGAPPDIYVMICGRVTPSQRDIIKKDVQYIQMSTKH